MNYKVIVAIAAITLLEIVALITHTNGVLLGAAIAAIAGLGGFEISRHRPPK